MEMTHLDQRGQAHMVDVSMKEDTLRQAGAQAVVRMAPGTLRRLLDGDLPKGEALSVARVAGIMAAKKTPELVPLCHPVRITRATVDFAALAPGELKVSSLVCARDSTGVEMEALTAVLVAALTVIDMCKAVDRRMSVHDVHVTVKSGGQSGDFAWQEGE